MAFKCKRCLHLSVYKVTEKYCESCKKAIEKEEIKKNKPVEIITYRDCPRCKKPNRSSEEECGFCGYSFITNKINVCPNCKRVRDIGYLCKCGYSFYLKKMPNKHVDYIDFQKEKRIFNLSVYDEVRINRKEKYYKHYEYELFSKRIYIGTLPDKYIKGSFKKYCLIKSVEKNRITVALSELPPNLLIEEIKKKLYEEEEAANEKKQLLESQYVSVGYREAHCHTCNAGITTKTHFICMACNWIKCHCGSCGCNYHGIKKKYYTY